MSGPFEAGEYVRRTDGRGGPRSQVGRVTGEHGIPGQESGRCVHVVWDSGDTCLIGDGDLEAIRRGFLPKSTVVKHTNGRTGRVLSATFSAYEVATTEGRDWWPFEFVHGRLAPVEPLVVLG